MFRCDQCGLCCRSLKDIDLYKDLDRGDGICKYLVENKCSIYNDRPLLCRIDKCYDLFFKNQYTKEEYYELNYKVCEELKQQQIN